ncbi:hypothetical protein SARC_00665 [Sphaeroforma arctica JP610]|uniref:Uncharacterized protein n=1 Tax=Sphaeroforma arctica JP610 TaxID=667725 RepID=A0A0L0GDZ1_9EUKA|nr:hypothetical protein SARC_00665 [Sphaeroforma arctica JP610]KNC87230.1 hypothetical protein SARC_00665 [Sphaeroforma arctica JP610]|eukprot:XP_014161132.1 hypothetical protein SARC_00665 [Sphaeroforma arctica JP610]
MQATSFAPKPKRKWAKTSQYEIREPTRRSTRSTRNSDVNYKDDSIPLKDVALQEQRLRTSKELYKRPVRNNSAKTVAVPPPNSIRHLDMNYNTFSGFEGKFFPEVIEGGAMKRAVMEALASPKRPVYNKMSGIQEWRNAIVLFINLDSSYQNTFQENYAKLIWYAQSRQTVESPVICRLLRSLAPGDFTDCGHEKCADRTKAEVHVFCRPPAQPYFYLGSVNAASLQDREKLPLKFILSLAQAKNLRESDIFLETLNGI